MSECIICNVEFQPNSKSNWLYFRTCSDACRQIFQVTRTKANKECVCPVCNKTYERRTDRPKTITCSRQCGRTLSVQKRIKEGTYKKKPETVEKARQTAIRNGSWAKGVETRRANGSYVRSPEAVFRMKETWKETGWYRERIELTCKNPECGKVFLYSKTRYEKYGRDFCSNTCARPMMVETIMRARVRGRGKGGYREDIRMHVRSTWEANLVRIFNLKGVKFEYEPRKYKLVKEDGSTTWYLPDFWVNGKVIEVKGFEADKSIYKARLLEEQYKIKTFIVDYKTYQWLKKRYSSSIENWED